MEDSEGAIMLRSACGWCMWVVIKILVPFWVLRIVRHLVFRGPNMKGDHNFDIHPCTPGSMNMEAQRGPYEEDRSLL